QVKRPAERIGPAPRPDQSPPSGSFPWRRLARSLAHLRRARGNQVRISNGNNGLDLRLPTKRSARRTRYVLVSSIQFRANDLLQILEHAVDQHGDRSRVDVSAIAFLQQASTAGSRYGIEIDLTGIDQPELK